MRAGANVALLGAALTGGLLLVAFVAGDPDGAAPGGTNPSSAPPRAAAAPAPLQEPARRAGDAPPPEMRGAGDALLTGQVIDDEEAAVQGAVVRAVRESVVVEEVKTGADGRFAVHCGRRPATGSVQIGVVAAFGNSRSAFESYELAEDSEGEDDLGQLQLRRAVPLVARVVDAAGPVAGARVYVGSFFGTVFATAVADAKGVAAFDATPETDAWLFAYAPRRGRARGEIPDGRDPKVPLVLTLTARTIRVSVVRMPAGVPAPDERIGAQILTEADGNRLLSAFVPPLELTATGDTGIVTIAEVAAEDAVELRRVARDTSAEPWRAPGRTGGTGTTVVAGPREIEARLDVFTGRTLRWRIVPGDVPPPPEGSVVELRRGMFGFLPSTAPTALRVDGGHLVGCDFSEGEVRGVAIAADGSIARLSGAEARFMRPRALAVTVREADGAALADVAVSLRSAADRQVGDSRRTGADGRAAFDGLEPELGLVDVWARTESPPDGRRVATVDLSRGDAELDVRLPRTQVIVLRVTTDGERRLPDNWRLFVDQSWEAAAAVEPPADIRVVARPRSRDEPIHVLLRADGRLDAEADVASRPGGETVFVDLASDRGVTLRAAYLPPSDRAHVPNPSVALQMWSPATQSWNAWRDRPYLVQDRRADPDGRFRFDGMPPARYRLLATMNYAYEVLASEVVDATLGGAPPPLTLDLSHGGNVGIRVIGADEKPIDGAWVAVEAGGAGDVGGPVAPLNRRTLAADGRGTVFVPGDRAVRLVARHTLMRPDPERGSVEVTEPGGEYALLLVDGPVLEFRLQPGSETALDVDTALARFDPEWASVRLFRGAATGDAVASPTPIRADGRLRAGGFPPGRYTIWIRFRRGAPIVLSDVDLKDGVNDLGELRPGRGSAVRLRLTVPEGQAAQRLIVTVARTDAPRYAVSVRSEGEAEIVVPGLGPGRFELVARTPSGSTDVIFRRAFDADGDHDVVLDSSPR